MKQWNLGRDFLAEEVESELVSSNVEKSKSDALKACMILVDFEDTSICSGTPFNLLNSHMASDSHNSSSQGPKHSENISGGAMSVLSVI